MALIAAYDKGDIVPLTATFRNAAGVLTNPTTVALTIIDPEGVEASPTPDNDSTGAYSHDLTLTKSGLWQYRWAGTGAVAEVEEGALYARSTRF